MILSDLPPAAQRDFARYTAYGWKAKIIMDLLNRRYGLRLTCDQIRRMQLLDLPRESKGVEFDPFSENTDVLPTMAKDKGQIKTAPSVISPETVRKV